jgi:tetratricopeptide (TPR) repeat protein
MSATFDDTKRQVVPRWLDYASSCALGLLRAVHSQPIVPSFVAPSARGKQEWRENPSLTAAVDLLAEALVVREFDSQDGKKAAEFLLRAAPKSSLLMREMARHFLEEPACAPVLGPQPEVGNKGSAPIALLRKSLRGHPLDPVAWSDLSLWYAMLGQVRKSRQSMLVAVELGGQSRFVLRSAARCFLHFGEPDRAVALLRGSGLCRCDPWIASAEIAISEGMDLRSVCVSQGRQIVLNENIPPYARSELAACLGTMEIRGGTQRKAKSLIRGALRDPSENALAQVEWMATQLHAEVPTAVQPPASYEAQSRRHHRDRHFKESFGAAQQWARFQPFSSRPLIQATFLATLCLDDNVAAIDIVRRALPAHRKNPLLMNNLAFAYARLGDVKAASEALQSVDTRVLSGRDQLVLSATRGLICFRSGQPEGGRELYRDSIRGFEGIEERSAAAVAAYFWAFEERRVGSVEAPTRIADAKTRIRRAGVFELEEAAKAL